MRPVSKSPWPQQNGLPKQYNPHTIAKTDLEINLDQFCSYCEVFSSDLEVEHVISRYQNGLLSHDWGNFLLACGRCNGKDNKSNKWVNINQTHFPHLNNTLISFVYKEGGYVSVNPALPPTSKRRATRLMNLVKLDKIPGNPRYRNLNPNDTRWDHRRIAWENAKKYLPIYEAGNLTTEQLVDFAYQRGFFSVWYNVYHNHTMVKDELIRRFVGTAPNCFDPGTLNLAPRNPGNIADQV